MSSLRDRLAPCTVSTGLHPGGALIPLYFLPGADVGSGAFWFEMRYFATAAGITDIVEFFKDQRARGILPRVIREYGLVEFDFIMLDQGRKHVPALASSRGLLAWITERWRMASKKAGEANATRLRWNELLLAWHATAKEAVLSMEGRPHIDVNGVEVLSDRVLAKLLFQFSLTPQKGQTTVPLKNT